MLEKVRFSIQDAVMQENDGALFVLPSQLNGAEYPSHEDIVYDVEDYKYDNTGGCRKIGLNEIWLKFKWIP